MNVIDIYGDESGWDSTNRYGSICIISGLKSNIDILLKDLNMIQDRSDRKEIKLKEIKNNSTVSIAKKYIDIICFHLYSSRIKLHAICWDKKDSRHNIFKRDDRENLFRMYFHLTNNCFKDWTSTYIFNFFPDEFNGVDWDDKLLKFLKNRRIEYKLELFEINKPVVNSIKEFEQFKSEKSSLIQVCDLFAGAIRMSRSESIEFQTWMKRKVKNQTLLFEMEDDIIISKTKEYQFQVLHHLKETCGKYSLGLNFSKDKYFQTLNKRNNIFVWHYKPQNDLDKAPIKD